MRIPTEADACYLSKLYRDDPDRFDQALLEDNADPMVLTDSKGNTLRYLCSAEGTPIFTRTLQIIIFTRGKIRNASTNLFTSSVDAIINFEGWIDDD